MRKAAKIQIRVEKPLYEAAIKVARENGTTASQYLEKCMWGKLEKWMNPKSFKQLQNACEACAADNGKRGRKTEEKPEKKSKKLATKVSKAAPKVPAKKMAVKFIQKKKGPIMGQRKSAPGGK